MSGGGRGGRWAAGAGRAAGPGGRRAGERRSPIGSSGRSAAGWGRRAWSSTCSAARESVEERMTPRATLVAPRCALLPPRPSACSASALAAASSAAVSSVPATPNSICVGGWGNRASSTPSGKVAGGAALRCGHRMSAWWPQRICASCAQTPHFQHPTSSPPPSHSPELRSFLGTPSSSSRSRPRG